MPPKSSNDSRPRIWAEGHQHPPFDWRAYALASVQFARESLSGLLKRCAGSTQEFAVLVGSGKWRVPENRLGRTGKWLPSVEATGRSLMWGAELLLRAARVALPQLDGATPRPASIFDAQPQTALTVEDRLSREALAPQAHAATTATEDDPDLEAIRLLLRDVPDSRPAGTGLAEAPATFAPKPALARTGQRQEFLTGPLAVMLGYGLLVVSIPVGAVQALLAHLNGEDLRKLVEDEA